MFITHMPKKGVLLDARYMQKKTAELFERMNIDLDPSTMVRDLDASYKQIIEIGRALLQDASLIIMDEPTTSLTEPEIKRVFAMMRTLKQQGVGIIFISHKLTSASVSVPARSWVSPVCWATAEVSCSRRCSVPWARSTPAA